MNREAIEQLGVLLDAADEAEAGELVRVLAHDVGSALPSADPEELSWLSRWLATRSDFRDKRDAILPARELALCALLSAVVAYEQAARNRGAREVAAGRVANEPLRWKILRELSIDSSTPTAIAERLQCTVESVSRNLRALRDEGLVECLQSQADVDGRLRPQRTTRAGEEVIQAALADRARKNGRRGSRGGCS